MAIEQAFEQLRARIKPAVLDQKSIANGQIMRAYMDSKGYDIASMSDDALASALYEACVAETAKLRWLVKPAKLKLLDEKPRTLVDAHKEQELFAEKAKKLEAAAADKKVQDKARGVTAGIISQFKLSSHVKTAHYQKLLHARVERGLKQRTAWKVIESDIRSKIEELYQAEERSLERVGQYVDAFADVVV